MLDPDDPLVLLVASGAPFPDLTNRDARALAAELGLQAGNANQLERAIQRELLRN